MMGEVYQLIEDATNVGIWHKDLKDQSNLQQHELMRILKTLETKKLIKSVKSIQFKNRKVPFAGPLHISRGWYRVPVLV